MISKMQFTEYLSCKQVHHEIQVYIFCTFLFAATAQIPGYEGELIHGNETVIYCNYTAASKPPGASVWYLVDKPYTSLCGVTEDDGTLRENPNDCYGVVTPSTDASFAFYLSLDFDRDQGMKWNCAIGSAEVYLNLNISGMWTILDV